MEWSIKRNHSNITRRQEWFLVGAKEEPIRIGPIWGGLSWPGVKAGYLVVMAQADSRDGRPLYLVKERELELTRDLVKAAADLQEAYQVTTWWHIGGDAARPFMTEAYRALDGIDDRKRPSFQDAPEYPPEYALSLLKSAMLQEHLKLHPDLSKMMDQLTQLSQTQDPIGKLAELPAVRALLLILGAVERSPWPPRDYSNFSGGFAKTYSKR